jgi:hypothetical protein
MLAQGLIAAVKSIGYWLLRQKMAMESQDGIQQP